MCVRIYVNTGLSLKTKLHITSGTLDTCEQSENTTCLWKLHNCEKYELRTIAFLFRIYHDTNIYYMATRLLFWAQILKIAWYIITASNNYTTENDIYCCHFPQCHFNWYRVCLPIQNFSWHNVISTECTLVCQLFIFTVWNKHANEYENVFHDLIRHTQSKQDDQLRLTPTD